MALLPTPGPDITPSFGSTKGFGGVVDTALNVLDPGKARLKIAGLFKGGISSLFKKGTPPGLNVQSQAPGNRNNVTDSDWRLKISLASNNTILYNDPENQIQEPLKLTNGVLLPYTPQVVVSHNARYQEQALTHSNYKNYFYEGSDVSAITITADFTVQNVTEGRYLLAVIYFLRSATKMFFGKDALAGNPPPIVYLNGYGDFYFPNVSCVVTSFQHTMPGDVDYLEVPYVDKKNGGYGAQYQIARLPTNSQCVITLQPVYSRNNIHNNMNLTEFSQGRLLGSKTSGRAGFL